MRLLSSNEVMFVGGGDIFGNALISVGSQLSDQGQRLESLPGCRSAGAAMERTGKDLIDTGNRHNDTTGGGPPGGDPKGG